MKLDKEKLTKLLEQAAKAHHKYETKTLKGKRDEEWAKWYADFIVGKIE